MKVKLVVMNNCKYCPEAKEIVSDLCNKHNIDYEIIDLNTLRGQEMLKRYNILYVPCIIKDNDIFAIPRSKRKLLRLLKDEPKRI